jgi:hypothetical protein
MSRFEIDVQTADRQPPYRFHVTVKEGAGGTRHEVTLAETTYQELTGGASSPEECVRLCFEFLLAREPKESILGHFDVTVIERYFPEFRQEFARLLGRG